MSKKVLLTGALIGAGLLLSYKAAASLNRTQANLEIIPYPALVGLNESNFSINLDINFKNPSSNEFSFMFPHVSVSYGEILIASSKVINKLITLKAYDEAWVRNMKFDIPILNALFAGASMVSKWNKGEAVILTIKTSTEIHIKGHVQSYDDIKNIPVSKPKLLGK